MAVLLSRLLSHSALRPTVSSLASKGPPRKSLVITRFIHSSKGSESQMSANQQDSGIQSLYDPSRAALLRSFRSSSKVNLPHYQQVLDRVGRGDTTTKRALNKRQELLKDHCRDVLRQKLMLLELISDDDYIKTVPAFFNATVAAHVRHSLQHMRRVLDLVGCETEDATTLCYDDRERNDEVEKNKGKAIKAITKLLTVLDTMQADDFLLPVHAEFVANAESGKKYAIMSSVEREMSFVAHHATHHLALINLMMKSLDYVVEKDIGLANSTKIHHSSMLPPSK
jgi:hypothetical protein